MVSRQQPALKIEKYIGEKARWARERDEITPRNGCELIVGVVARISGGPKQRELSLEDQVDHAKEKVSESYAGPVELRIVATKGKGEDLERPELKIVEQQIRTRELDLLICEDVGRLVRGAEPARLWGIAVDHGTRVLSLNECIDTRDDGWEQEVIRACGEAVGHNIQTSKRIKQKKQNRFRKFGGATPCPIAGYEKPAGAETYGDWRKIDEDTPVVEEGKRLLHETRNCSRVAAYFNRVGFKPGPYCRRADGKWDGKMVRRYYANPLLGGRPGRGFRHTIKLHERGKRISVPKPEGPDYFDAPHLAHVDYDELVALNELLRKENSKLGRKPINGVDPRLRVPRKSTVFPSQHARCYYCGYHYVRGGNGIIGHITCTNAREYRCWNSIGAACDIAAAKSMEAITTMLLELGACDDQFCEMVERAHAEHLGVSAEQWKSLESEEKRVARELDNLIDAIKKYGADPRFEAEVGALRHRQLQLGVERRAFEKIDDRKLVLPTCVDELRDAFERRAKGLDISSPEFGDVMRQLIPGFHIYLVRLLDGGAPVPRARLTIDLRPCCTDLELVPGAEALLTKVVDVDLFKPPQRVRLREEIVRLEGGRQRDIARQVSEPTFQVTVQKALALNRMMLERGLSSPYVVLTEPPDDYEKLRRYKNERYAFQMLEGYQPFKF